jgi:PAS domain S-box-containing protein
VVQGEDFSRLLFERSPVGMNLCRMDGLWLESNPAFLAMLGYSREEADGKLTYWQLTPREYDPQEAVQLESLARTGRYGPYEKEFLRKDGARVPVRLNGFIVEREGERYIWSLIEDITERRRLEASVETERLKAIRAAKLAALGELAAGVAHEVNNPLAVIEGWLEVLRRTGPSGDPALFGEGLEKIGQATDRAAEIVRGLRKIARDDAGAPPRRCSLREVVEQTLDLYRERLRSHGVDLRLALDADAEVLVRPSELWQVLVNLINNAHDAIQGRAERWIELRTERRYGDRIAVRVTDSGPGVEPALRERVFDPFFTTKEVGRGTGLGLSISQRIMQDLGGALLLDDRPGGASFVAELPRAGEAPRA